MYTGNLAAVSNRETWTFGVALVNNETNLAYDLTGATVQAVVRSQVDDSIVVEASTSDGRIVVADPTDGTFVLTVPESVMAQLCVGMFDVGMRVIWADGTYKQIMAATLPVKDGVFAQ